MINPYFPCIYHGAVGNVETPVTITALLREMISNIQFTADVHFMAEFEPHIISIRV
jgi:hypothetical protein